jgi:hypothetical protein
MAMLLPDPFKPRHCQLQKLWYCGQIPVRVRKLNMSEKGAKNVNASFDIHTFSIPANQRIDSKSMAKVVHSWAMIIRETSYANLA